MTVSYTPTYYPLPGGRSTSEPTPGPVSPTEAFYQEEQSGLCILQSLNAFAGRHVVDFTAYAQVNNAYVMNASMGQKDVVGQEDFNSQPDRFLLESIDDLDNVNKSFVFLAPYLYISKNKKLFGLPDTCEIRPIFSVPSDFEEEIQYIDEHPSIHRVTSTSISQKHAFTFRKDLSGQWRVIDSWSHYHNANERDPLKRLQPAFPTFKEAFAAHFARLQDPGPRLLTYSIEDAIPSGQPAPSSPALNPAPNTDVTPPPPPASPSSTAEKRKPTQACCLMRLWEWVVARICALFCCRRP